jgi:predicted dehydrogenase
MLGVAVVGCGYWGPNLIRNFAVCPDTRLVAVCDRDPARLAKALAPYPGVDGVRDYDDLLRRPDVQAVAVATPVHTHADLAMAALEAGKHVLVEKPLAASVAEAAAVVRLAERNRLTLLVDHVFVYSPAVRKIKELIDTGELGDLYFVDSVRINLGLFQGDVNVVWDLAPHDLSILDYLVGRPPLSVAAFGGSHTRGPRPIEDVAYLSLDFGGGLLASIHVNWLSPVKVRNFILGGSHKSVVYNELDPAEKLKVYDRGITVRESVDPQRLLIGYRIGDVWAPHLDRTEPLQRMVCHFAECVRTGARPLTDGASGLRVVRILDAADRSIKAQGARVALPGAAFLPASGDTAAAA